MKFLVKLLTSGFFIGYYPAASGTVASVFACLLWILMGQTSYYFIFPLFFTAGGFLLCGYAEKHIWHENDPSQIVIDEIAGMLVTFVSFSFSPTIEGIVYTAGGLGIFRLLDIFKPGPVRMVQRLHGSPGIMLDDLLSGVLANGFLQLLRVMLF